MDTNVVEDVTVGPVITDTETEVNVVSWVVVLLFNLTLVTVVGRLVVKDWVTVRYFFL